MDEKHERRQERVEKRVIGGVEDERSGPGLGRQVDGPLGQRARCVGPEQEHHVGALALEHLYWAVAQLGALDYRAVHPHVLHEHGQRELVGQSVQRPGRHRVQHVRAQEPARRLEHGRLGRLVRSLEHRWQPEQSLEHGGRFDSTRTRGDPRQLEGE